MTILKTLLLGLALLAHAASAALSQDPVPIYPENYKVLFENDRVRVLDFQLRKGAKEDFHSHAANVVYVLAPFRVQFTLRDGQTKIREAKAGDVFFSEPVTHASNNIGDTDAHGLIVELKTQAATEATTAASGGTGAEEDVLTAVTFIHGIPGQEQDLERHLLSLTAPTRAEAGSMAYDLYQSVKEPAQFMRIEVWRDEAALEAHKMTPHLKASFERRQKEGWTTEITLWRRVGK